ncbi:hypothetical protein OA2633_05146 [Oceanicaulis sp. HTCC2633]|uniref:hypothetical protein n=1 Tax=Oceanicaulis sp. HTCC2633 TaxID=314254 RepID=UPI000066D421|nr:hypothetical protein [Oceanicaulis sp. HTCC2633]EAP91537.1 hypothetical protein OA2633_05146 [Oceanicaulis sp. HTCC2633]
MSHRPQSIGVDIAACADRIEDLQLRDGAIPWIETGVWDPWNHGESAMALAVAGRETAVHAALDALAERQHEDGSWLGELGAGVPMDESGDRIAPPENPVTARDTNFTGYAAVTVLRCALALDEPRLIARHAGMITRALDWVVSHQTPHGDVVWRKPDDGQPLEDVDSLKAGNASLYKSLECGLRIADALDQSRPDWARARKTIAQTFTDRPHRFDRLGEDRSRYAMDWYYPVLSGVLTGLGAKAHLHAGWDKFVVEDLGCRCVSEEPWITAAETAELALACLSIGETVRAQRLLGALAPLARDGLGYWMGWQFELGQVWPKERPSWTAGAVVLAADALYGLSNGSDLLIRHARPDAWLKGDAESRAY